MSQLLPTIYKRASTGKVQEWTIEVDGNKFRTITGSQGGKKVESKWTVCKGKNPGKANATTPEAQALKEAEAKRRLKLEDDYYETIDDIDSGNRFKSPMLAQEYGDAVKKEKISFPLHSQPKLDGIRCIATKDGLFSRKGKKLVGCPHIERELKPLFDQYPDMELDGELYNHDLKDDFNHLVSLIKKAGRDTDEKMQYWIYDIRDPSLIFSKRMSKILLTVGPLDSDWLVIVPTVLITDQKGADTAYEIYLGERYEGQMLRKDTTYTFDRVYDLIKRKEFITEEFEILDVLEGKGNRSGMAGKVVVRVKDDKTSESNIKANWEYCIALLKNRDTVIGKMATVRYQNYTPDGKLRFPEMITIRDYE